MSNKTEEKNRSSVWIGLDSHGVYRVQLRAQSWEDEPVAAAIYERVAYLVHEMNRVLHKAEVSQ